MILAINIAFWIIFYVLFGLAHGKVAINLKVAAPKVYQLENYLKYKEHWHNLFAALRAFLHLSQFILLWLYTNFSISASLSLIGLALGILLFDSMVNLGRELKITWKYQGTCEGSWDFDCLWLRIDKIIPHWFIKIAMVCASIIYYICVTN